MATSGTLSFVEGQTSAAVTVPVFGDTKVEPTELFTLDISKPAPVAAVSLGSAEIFDDDAGRREPAHRQCQPDLELRGDLREHVRSEFSELDGVVWTRRPRAR